MRYKTPEKAVAAILEDVKAGELSKDQIAHRHKVHVSTVYNIQKQLRKRKSVTPSANKLVGNNGSGKYTALQPKIKSLVRKGFSAMQISKKLRIPSSAASYYVYTKFKNLKGAQSNGNSNSDRDSNRQETNTSTIKIDHVVGIAFNERERYTEKVIEALGTRYGFPVSVLRQRLSRLSGGS